MEYIKQTFKSGQILTAENMNYIEDGIANSVEHMNTIEENSLSKTNETEFTPTGDYNPSTKKYVDDTVNESTILEVCDVEIGIGANGLGTISDSSARKNLGDLVNYAYQVKRPLALNIIYNDYGSSQADGLFSVMKEQTIYHIIEDFDQSHKIWIRGEWVDGVFTCKEASRHYVKNDNYIGKYNTYSYTPTGDYHPATKKYVDDTVATVNTALESALSTVDTDIEAVNGSLNNKMDKTDAPIYTYNFKTVTAPTSTTMVQVTLTEEQLTYVNKIFDDNFDEIITNRYMPYGIHVMVFKDTVLFSDNSCKMLVGNGSTSMQTFFRNIETGHKYAIFFKCNINHTDKKFNIESIELNKQNMWFLSNNNMNAYEVDQNYKPAHKKYVDDKVASANTYTDNAIANIPTGGAETYIRSARVDCNLAYSTGHPLTDYASEFNKVFTDILNYEGDKKNAIVNVVYNDYVLTLNKIDMSDPNYIYCYGNWMDGKDYIKYKMTIGGTYENNVYTCTYAYMESAAWNNFAYEIDVNNKFATYLSKTNTTEFTPTGDYHPATKKYVDESIMPDTLIRTVYRNGGHIYTGQELSDLYGELSAFMTEITSNGLNINSRLLLLVFSSGTYNMLFNTAKKNSDTSYTLYAPIIGYDNNTISIHYFQLRIQGTLNDDNSFTVSSAYLSRPKVLTPIMSQGDVGNYLSSNSYVTKTQMDEAIAAAIAALNTTGGE